MEQFAVTNEQRKELFERLSEGIDGTGLTLNEFTFATADLLKSTFWVSLSTAKTEEELVPMRERIGAAINGIVEVLDNNTDSIAEDMVVIASIMMEAVNHVMSQAQDNVPAE